MIVRDRRSGTGPTGYRKAQGERRPGAFRAPDAHLAAVVGRDVLDDGQSQAGAAGVAGPGRVGPVEPLEDPLDVALRDADALVGDADLDLVRRCARTPTTTLVPLGE